LTIVACSNASADLVSEKPSSESQRKVVVSLYQAGEYKEYFLEFKSTIEGLERLGWIQFKPGLKSSDYPGSTLHGYWDWISDSIVSDHLIFKKNNFFSANWNDEERPIVVDHIYDQVASDGIDVIYGMGTASGIDLTRREEVIPTFILSSNNPVAAGIVKQEDYSGSENIHANVDVSRYREQFSAYFELTGFKSIGIPIVNSPLGLSYLNLDSIKGLEGEYDFVIIPCFMPDVSDLGEKEIGFYSCTQKLIDRGVDALYISQQSGLNEEVVRNMVKVSNQNGVMTFSQYGKEEAAWGVMMSMTRSDFSEIGDANARNLGYFLNGARLDEIPMEFKNNTVIYYNRKTAEKIGYRAPELFKDLLISVD
jgi:ABC-type uncharacterized transport system substrate-binding protein